jgi:hypothetical protein
MLGLGWFQTPLELPIRTEFSLLPSSAPSKSLASELLADSVGAGRGGGLAPRKNPDFLFVANYGHPPNVLAAIFLAKKVMPLIRARIPGATLSLAGPTRLRRLRSGRGVGFACSVSWTIWQNFTRRPPP